MAAKRERYFFLAYAHTPERPWVNRFYQALCQEIVERTDWPTDLPVGFMDEGIRPGEDWREAVAEGLATCRVLVPLYSRRYFSRPQCGFEWHGFSRRLLEHRARYGRDMVSIVPALWTPVEEQHIPEAAKHLQVDFTSVHPNYATEGLYTLIKNRAYRSTYQRVVAHLAQEIIRAAETQPLAPCPVNELDLSYDAFRSSTQDVPPDRRLTIMVAAPTSGRLPAGRRSDCYGTTPTSWIPFQPDSMRPVAETAAAIARDHDYEPVVVGLEEGLDGQDWSSPDSGVGIVLVDPWLCADPEYARQARRVDELGLDRIGAVLLWNLRDEQTDAKSDEIRKLLQAVAPNLIGDPATPASLGATRVHSLVELGHQMPSVLDRALNRYLNHVGVPPPPDPPEPTRPLPRLTGPGPGDDTPLTGPQPTGGPDGN